MSRFHGPAGRRLLIEALGQQPALGCCRPLISKIASAVAVKKHPKGSQLTVQDSSDNRLAFLLSGRVDIFVKGQKVAERTAGQHIGEMSVIDPKARRAATVVAAESTEVAWIQEKDFSRIAQVHPELWRTFAVELGERLRQRSALLRDRNPHPEIFIGSSTESLDVAKTIERRLSLDAVKVLLWSRGVFGVSRATIESLERLLPRTDFAILILTADDRLITRRKDYVTPRDNVIFELGLFIGAIGRDRTIMLVENKSRAALRLPPDLYGVTYIPIEIKRKKLTADSATRAISEIRNRVAELHTR